MLPHLSGKSSLGCTWLSFPILNRVGPTYVGLRPSEEVVQETKLAAVDLHGCRNGAFSQFWDLDIARCLALGQERADLVYVVPCALRSAS